jgi:hypothetical protein
LCESHSAAATLGRRANPELRLVVNDGGLEFFGRAGIRPAGRQVTRAQVRDAAS